MITNCAVCGKAFDVLWPHLWRYKRGQLFLCSWKCLRLFDGKEEKGMYTKVKKDGTPAKRPGPKAKKVETPEGGLAEAMVGMKDAADTFFGQCEEMGLNIGGSLTVTQGEDITVDAEKATKFVTGEQFEYKVTGIDTAVGTFQYFKSNQYLDWTDLNGETVSMNLEEWREFLKVIPDALKVLGVEL